MKKLAAFLVQMSLLWGLMVAPTLVSAVEMKGLYKASVAVADRSDAERKRAISAGFSQVLVRVTGDSSVIGQDAVQAAAADAERFVLQYGYETRTTPAGTGVDAGTPNVFLNVQYDSNGITNFLRRSGLPIWATNRPAILVWMAWEQGLDRELVNGSGSIPGTFQMLNAEAQRRGVPLAFPVFDAQDRSQVSIGDIWGMFSDPVMAASERYQSQVVLMAKVRESAGAIQINALLQMDGQQYWFDVNQPDAASALRMLMDQVVDKLGAHYALVTSGELSQQVLLQVDGVGSLKAFAALNRYLDGLLPISLYRMQGKQGDQVVFLVTLSNSLDALEQSFRVDRKLAPEPVAPLVAPPVEQPESSQEPQETMADENTPQPPVVDAPVVPAVPAPIVIHYRWRG